MINHCELFFHIYTILRVKIDYDIYHKYILNVII